MRRLFLIFISLLFTLSLLAMETPEGVERETILFAVVDGEDSLFLDRYDAPGAVQFSENGKKPCLIFAFGGGFVSGERDNEDYISFFEHMANEGLIVASIDYRLGFKDYDFGPTTTPEQFVTHFFKTIDMAVSDMVSSLGYIYANAEQWGVDRERLIVSGSSAGAVTALQTQYLISNKRELFKGIPADFNLGGVVAFAGAILTTENLEFKDAPAPILMFHGDADSNVPYGAITEMGLGFHGSAAIAEVLEESDAPYWFWSQSNAAHELASVPMHKYRDEIVCFIKRFVVEKENIQIKTSVSGIGEAEMKKNFTIMDYVISNFQ